MLTIRHIINIKGAVHPELVVSQIPHTDVTLIEVLALPDDCARTYIQYIILLHAVRSQVSIERCIWWKYIACLKSKLTSTAVKLRMLAQSSR